MNTVLLTGTLAADAAIKSFGDGSGKLANIVVMVENNTKDKVSGKYVDDPVSVQFTVFNSKERQSADECAAKGRRGARVFIEAKVSKESWNDQRTGQKREKPGFRIVKIEFIGSSLNQPTAPPQQSVSQPDIYQQPSESEPF